VHKVSLLVLRNTVANEILTYMFIDDKFITAQNAALNSLNDWTTNHSGYVSLISHSWQTNSRLMYCNRFYFGSGQEFMYRNYISSTSTMPS
jgi:hypothetical protein